MTDCDGNTRDFVANAMVLSSMLSTEFPPRAYCVPSRPADFHFKGQIVRNWSLVIPALVVALSGCGEATEGTVSVSGSVTINGVAVTQTGYGIRFEIGDRQIVLDVDEDGTFSGDAFEGKGSAFLTGGYTYPEPPAEGEELPAEIGPEEEVEYAPIEIEVTSGASIELNFTSE